MAMKSTAEIRRGFLKFFEQNGHTIVPSSPLVPENDPTLLFINAGMNQFKNVFLGLEKRPYTRATTAQRCVRAGGKHNDLENVGFTARHHTFFEMMGNFSFGDYFKKDAIRFAWNFLTGKDTLALDPNRLTVTVYETDDEAYNIWKDEIGVPVERIIRIGDNKGAPFASDNFWQMADTGPCGPCTEIFYDHGEHIWGGPPGSAEEDGDRFIEIWNIVFMQYNRLEDGTMQPLPKPSVDTGMGIERVAAILQHVNSNYDIDVFKYLIAQAAKVTEVEVTPETRFSLNVISDHIRACTFLIGDGVIPSNEGRGYVLRRIIRRAVRYGYLLGVRKAFFHKLVEDVVKVMEDAAEYLNSPEKIAFITKILRLEEEQFFRTIDRGINLLNNEIATVKEANSTVLPGTVAFTLLDTYGFPFDLTVDICKEQGISVDQEGFEVQMEKQRQLAKASSKFSANYADVIKTDGVTEKAFYKAETLYACEAKVTEIYVEGKAVDFVDAGHEAVIITDSTPFYAESGGQIGDTGVIKSDNLLFDVTDTQKYALAIGHHGKVVAGELRVGDYVQLEVDEKRRKDIIINHSAAHLLHAAVQQVLGKTAQQRGSYTGNDISRFDISHPEQVTREQLLEIERIVNYHIRANHQVEIIETSVEKAKEMGALALFGEKYGDVVRCVVMSPFSVELCGGIHAASTGEIGLFKILTEVSVSAGIRRIEYVTGERAIAEMQNESSLVADIARLANRSKQEVVEAYTQISDQVKALQKAIERLNEKLAFANIDNLILDKEVINGVNILITRVAELDTKTLKPLVHEGLNRFPDNAIVVLVNENSDKSASVVVGVKNVPAIKAGEVVKEFAAKFGGKGGGNPSMAMGSIPNIDNLIDEFSNLRKSLIEKLS